MRCGSLRRAHGVTPQRSAFWKTDTYGAFAEPAKRRGAAISIQRGERFCYSCRVKKYLLAAVLLFVIPSLLAQSDTTGTVPGDANALLAKAAPYYDYQSSEMKPWHVRYHYQYFDIKGMPSAEGEFDYWWSAKVSRASWTHGTQSHVEWHSADGKEMRSVTGDDVTSLEHRLVSALLPRFAKTADFDSGDWKLKYFTMTYPSGTLDCAGSVRSADNRIASLHNIWPSYCFEGHDPVLVASHENGTIMTFYGNNQPFHHHNFPGEIQIFYAGMKRVDANLEELSGVLAEDAAFTPSMDAKPYIQRTTMITVPIFQMPPLVITTKVNPTYPLGAAATRVGGTVVVAATIDKEGKVKDASVVSSPGAAFSDAALDAVRQWRYKPIMVNGQPMELHTTISVNFAP